LTTLHWIILSTPLSSTHIHAALGVPPNHHTHHTHVHTLYFPLLSLSTYRGSVLCALDSTAIFCREWHNAEPGLLLQGQTHHHTHSLHRQLNKQGRPWLQPRLSSSPIHRPYSITRLVSIVGLWGGNLLSRGDQMGLIRHFIRSHRMGVCLWLSI
jgi:hypothetical protein